MAIEPTSISFRGEKMLQHIFRCGLLALGAWALSTPSASATVLLQYDASSGLTPSQLPTNPWTNFGQSMTVGGGKLTQHASDGGTAGAPSQEYLSPSLPSGTFKRGGAPYGIEFRAQPLTDTAFVGNAWPRAYLTWSDDQFNYNITLDKFSAGNSSGTGDIVYGQSSFSPAITGIDWTVPHTIFIGQRGDGTSSVFDFYLDGVLKSTVTDGSIARNGSFARDAIDFGDGTTASNAVTADWYSVRVLNTNAVPEPCTGAIVALVGGAVLGRRRMPPRFNSPSH